LPRHLIGGDGVAEKHTGLFTFLGKNILAKAGPRCGGMAAESEGAKPALDEIIERHFSHTRIIRQNGGDVDAAELGRGDGAGGVDHGNTRLAEAFDASDGMHHRDDTVHFRRIIKIFGDQRVHGRHQEFPIGAEVGVLHDTAQDTASVAACEIELDSDSDHLSEAAKRGLGLWKIHAKTQNSKKVSGVNH
jgi:hypothetical protein